MRALDNAKIDLKKKGVLVEEPVPLAHWQKKKGTAASEQKDKDPEIDPVVLQEWRR